MAIDKKLIHFKSKDNFLNALNGTEPTAGSEATGDALYGQIKGSSIVFIQDTNEIWTHGTLYKSVNWSVLEPQLITFIIDDVEYESEEGMTWGEWVESEYNTNYCSIDNGYVSRGHYGFISSTSDVLTTVPDTKIIIEGEQYYTRDI